MIIDAKRLNQEPLRAAITKAYRMDEKACVDNLIKNVHFSEQDKQRIAERAAELVTAVRADRVGKGGLDSFMYQYDLSSEEGIALMCLAEALLRIPDKDTVEKLIRDKIADANWHAHLGKSESTFVNAATWGLMLTGKIMGPKATRPSKLSSAFGKLVKRGGEPFIRKAVTQAMKILSKQFIMGRTIEEGMKRAREMEQQGYRYSYDMLGEAARTAKDADEYFEAYQHAISTIKKISQPDSVMQNPGVSVKLSGLFPRYEFSEYERAIDAVSTRLLYLAKMAKEANINLTVDAEEADRLDLSLDIFECVFRNPDLNGWEGFGLALQSYQKRAWYVIDWLVDLSKQMHKRIPVRLIKGAYWDTEIKISQELGLEDYPVFTRKPSTDVSFLACAQKILKYPEAIYPQFATHNASSVAAILEMAGDRQDFEFQCLHGMGQALYHQIVGPNKLNHPCRVYAPIGSHEDLLAYLVRRLLENGANTSFVNRIVDAKAPVSDLVADPIDKVKSFASIQHPNIPSPSDIYGAERKNSKGLDITNFAVLKALNEDMEKALEKEWHAKPTIRNSKKTSEQGSAVYDPSSLSRRVGWVTEANEEDIEESLKRSQTAFKTWSKTTAEQRAELLVKASELYEAHMSEFIALAVREAGKSIPDSIAEVREAVDFMRYYAVQACKIMKVEKMPGPTGQYDELALHPRGIFACISPWNFPLAIFTGEISAALATGNTVIAKPAEQTPLIASFAVELLHQAGFPRDVIQLLPGRGEIVGAKLVADTRVQGVVFTGSTETARAINQTLANRLGAFVPFIAETGGQNAMIVDSSALHEQVVKDVCYSAFNSAGQRCSALRVLYVQDDVAEKVLTMLRGAMAELEVGDPAMLSTDVGPVIDNDAKTILENHAAKMAREAKLIYQVELKSGAGQGNFFAPRAYELKHINELKREVFGPVLHVIRFKSSQLDQVIDDINSTGYGLTMGLHSRIDETIDYVQDRIHVGNMYVNRNMIGAVVGVQPFGGEGLSGTGPKAGGPHYLYRFCAERALSINTTAAGGNASLMTLGE